MTEQEALEAMVAREPIFHRAEFGTGREDFAHMTAEDYWEVGASGKVYRRDFVLDMLVARQGKPEQAWEASGFVSRRLGEHCWLLTYALVQDGVRRTRRSTVWEFVEGDWRIVYHQGTVVED